MKRAAWLVALVALAGCHQNEPLDVAPNVDLQRFQGKWYEIAHLPRPTQVDCHGTTQFVTLGGDGSLTLVNECKVGALDGPTRGVNARGQVPDPTVPAKLSVDFGGGFWGDYWILEVGEHYEVAVVGHPSRDYLWIMSRTPTLDAATLGPLLDHARAAKFDVSRLEYTVQE